ncbi:MAG: bifunctional riboflavin kinase/FAD synthetase [Rhodothalassiaceae bacterium]
MRILADLDASVTGAAAGTVLAVGNFDGFHRGHQAVVAQAAALARSLRAQTGVLTFEPHPRSFFRPEDPPFRLSPRDERRHLLQAFGIDLMVELPFDQTLSQTSAMAFLDRLICHQLQPSGLVIGYDYRFGKARAGDAALMEQYLVPRGIAVEVVSPVAVGVEGSAGAVYSSTLVRQALRDGQARRAAALLGHWWALNGVVQKGDQRGRTIGFPTANIPLGEALRPAFGVYAIRAVLTDGRVLNGVANIGRRPTFQTEEARVEAHLFDFAEDLYGQTVRVELVGFLRGERRFDGLDALKAQIALDAQNARAVLADPENARDRLLPPRLHQHSGEDQT